MDCIPLFSPEWMFCDGLWMILSKVWDSICNAWAFWAASCFQTYFAVCDLVYCILERQLYEERIY